MFAMKLKGNRSVIIEFTEAIEQGDSWAWLLATEHYDQVSQFQLHFFDKDLQTNT